jgi:hypothetical protein
VGLNRANIGVRQLKDVLTVRVLLICIGGRHSFFIPREGVMGESILLCLYYLNLIPSYG